MIWALDWELAAAWAAAAASALAFSSAAFFSGCLGFSCGGVEGGFALEGLLDGRVEGGRGSGDDEDLLKLVEVGGGVEGDGGIGLVLWVGGDGFYGADGESAGEDLIASGGEDGFTGLDAVVGGEVGDLDAAGGVAVDDGADAGGLKDDAGTGGGVVYQEKLAGCGEDVAELADDAVGGDDGHVGLEAVMSAFIQDEDATLV